jgi:hypothetical protein
MKPNTARILRALFYAYVVVTFVHIAFVVYHEPFAFDAWNVAHDTGAKPATIGRFFEFWHQQYTTSNPRIGQPLAYLAYKLVGVAEIGTPLAYFAIVIAGFTLASGRLPRRANDRDLAVLAVGIGVMWFAAPNLPAYMFSRAYATNYLWAIAIQMWFLVPLRLHLRGSLVRITPARLVGYSVIGVAAGMCTEHTGPTLLLFVLGYALWCWRKQIDHRAIVFAGAAGALVGYLLVFFAPGQSQRYEGLAERYSLVQQILVRGIAGNVDIFLNYIHAVALVMVLAVAAVVIGSVMRDVDSDEERAQQRRALAFVAVALLAGALITVTVFASPKLGPRFYFHACLLLLGGLMGVLSAFVRRPRAFAPFVVVALISSAVAIGRTVPTYFENAKSSDRRWAELAATPPGGVYTAEGWSPVQESWWALGDDIRDQKKQEMIAKYFGLDRVLFRAADQWKTLGVTDVKLTSHYELDRPLCLDELDDLDIQPYVGRDIAAIHHAFLNVIVKIERISGAKVHYIDLTATFLGAKPPMPSKKLYVARWTDGVLEGYPARMKRVGRAKTREVVLAPAMKQSPWDVVLVRIGDKPKKLGVSNEGKPLTYVPWDSGTYWVTACREDYCFIVLSVAHTI